MPNHVHVLFRVESVPMSRVLNAWKGYTAKEANKVLERNGRFWQQDYWDTYVRNEEHELKTRRYIENNPAKARLVAFRKDWPWSSARFREARMSGYASLVSDRECPSSGTASSKAKREELPGQGPPSRWKPSGFRTLLRPERPRSAWRMPVLGHSKLRRPIASGALSRLS